MKHHSLSDQEPTPPWSPGAPVGTAGRSFTAEPAPRLALTLLVPVL